MNALLRTCLVSLAAVVGLGCTAAKEGPADVGAGLFSVVSFAKVSD